MTPKGRLQRIRKATLRNSTPGTRRSVHADRTGNSVQTSQLQKRGIAHEPSCTSSKKMLPGQRTHVYVRCRWSIIYMHNLHRATHRAAQCVSIAGKMCWGNHRATQRACLKWMQPMYQPRPRFMQRFPTATLSCCSRFNAKILNLLSFPIFFWVFS